MDGQLDLLFSFLFWIIKAGASMGVRLGESFKGYA